MGNRPRSQCIIFSVLLACATLAASENPQKQELDRQYQSAVADYEAGHYASAADQLEKLLPYAPNSYEIHEFLGLAYASPLEDSRAVDYLKTAVQLRPNLAEARTNLGASLLHSGKAALAGEQFRKALALEPQSFDANHNLGEYYVQLGEIADATPLLEEAQEINPGSYDNGYDLAMSDFPSDASAAQGSKSRTC